MILNYTDDTTKEIGPMIFTVFFHFPYDNGITEKKMMNPFQLKV